VGHLSIIMPTHRRPHLLPRALRSLLAQSEPDWRPVVAVNGCPEQEGQYRAALAPFLYDERIAVQWSVTPSLPRALNRGLAFSTGRYLAVLEDDDEWDADFLRAMSRTLDARPDVGMVYCRCREVTAHGEPCRLFSPWGAWDHARMLQGNWIGFPQAMVRTHLLWQIGGYAEECGGAADWDTWLRLARISHVEGLDQTLITHHWDGDNMCLEPEVNETCQRIIRGRRDRHLYDVLREEKPI